MMNDVLIVGLIAGAIVGVWPLMAGMKANQQSLAVGGFVATLIGGAILGLLLAVPVAIFFAWLIARASKAAGASGESAETSEQASSDLTAPMDYTRNEASPEAPGDQSQEQGSEEDDSPDITTPMDYTRQESSAEDSEETSGEGEQKSGTDDDNPDITTPMDYTRKD